MNNLPEEETSDAMQPFPQRLARMLERRSRVSDMSSEDTKQEKKTEKGKGKKRAVAATSHATTLPAADAQLDRLCACPTSDETRNHMGTSTPRILMQLSNSLQTTRIHFIARTNGAAIPSGIGLWAPCLRLSCFCLNHFQ